MCYTNVITYRNMDVCIYDIINKIINQPLTTPNIYLLFKPVLIKLFLENYEKIQEKINTLTNVFNLSFERIQIVNIYNMKCTINYNELDEKIKKIKIELENKIEIENNK